MSENLYRLLLLLLIMFQLRISYGQEQSTYVLRAVPQFDTSALNTYREDPRYQYQHEAAKSSWLAELWQNFLRRLRHAFSESGTFAERTFMLLLFAGAIVVLIYFFMNAGFHRIFSRKNTGSGESITILNETVAIDAIADRIAAAESTGDFRTAFRWSYIDLLHNCARADLIRLHPNKTNTDYKLEMSSSHLRQDFLLLADQFDYIWYGEYPIDADTYRENRLVFQRILNQLKGA